MAATLSIVSSVITILAFNFLLLIKYYDLESHFIMSIFISVFSVGGITYLIVTIMAYFDYQNKKMTPVDKEFWKNVIIKCAYQFCGAPVYYLIAENKLLKENNATYKPINYLWGDLVYNIFRFEVYGCIILISLSALIAVISLIFTELVNIPPLLFKIAFFMFVPFITVSYIFYLVMLYEFVQVSNDSEALKYFFGKKRWLFGVVKYYKESRKLRA